MMKRAARSCLLVAAALLVGYLGCARGDGDAQLVGVVPIRNEVDASIDDDQGQGGAISQGGSGQGGAGPGASLGGNGGSVASGGTQSMADAGGEEDCATRCDDDNDCTEETCPGNGDCMHVAVPGTPPCADDGDVCTNDLCNAGTCTHPATGLCECGSAAECDDSNPCTDDDCVAGTCEYADNTDPCTDDSNPCTDDVCAGGSCTHPNNTDPCTDDSNPCTDDVCADGICTHDDNMTCECMDATDCEDNNACTDDSCDGNHECVNAANTDPCTDDGDPCTDDVCAATLCTHPYNTDPCAGDGNPCTTDVCDMGTCTHDPIDPCTGTPFAVNTFNGGWSTDQTMPDLHTMVKAGTVSNSNPEGGTIIYLAVNNTTYTISMSIKVPSTPQSLAGLTNLKVIIGGTAGTEAMVRVGLSTSTTVGDAGAVWSERPLTGYETFTGTSVGTPGYKTFTIPLADFAVADLNAITQVRVQFVGSGGLKEWRLNDVSAD